MKVSIYGGEAFPVYKVSTGGLTEVEVDAEKLDRWQHAFEQFNLVQQEIVACLEEQGHGDEVWANGTWNGFHVNREVVK